MADLFEDERTLGWILAGLAGVFGALAIFGWSVQSDESPWGTALLSLALAASAALALNKPSSAPRLILWVLWGAAWIAAIIVTFA